MGVRGLSEYITQNQWVFLQPFELKNMTLVVDGVSLCCNHYEKVDRQFGLMGGQYDLFYESVKNFLDALLLCQVRPIVIIGGIETLTKKDYVMRFEYKLTKFVEREAAAIPPLVHDVFLLALRNLKIRFVQTIAEATETMFAVAEAYNCPILSENDDFFMYPIRFIPWKTLSARTHRREGTMNWTYPCQMYNYKKFCRVFHDLNESLLPLALVILGNKYDRSHLDDEIMKPLFEQINSVMPTDYLNPNSSEARIENTLQWLSDYSSVDEAIGEVLNWIDECHRSKILSDIKTFINGLGVCSPLAFMALGLPEEMVSKLRADNEKKALLLQEHQTKEERDGEPEFTERKIIDMFPARWIEDFAKGRLQGLPFELVMYSTAILKPLNENYAYPPTGVISLPILKSIYSLICSLRENDADTEVLEIISTKGKEIIREEVRVEKSPVNSRGIEKLDLSERKRIIDEILGVEGVVSLHELPYCWRLHMATAIFWMRQEVPPQRTKNHLLSVILMMVLGIIDDKIQFVRSQETFSARYGNKYRDIISEVRPIIKRVTRKHLRERLRITEPDCIAALPFFISMLEFEPPEEDWKTTVYIFSQFHSCLQNSQHLNSILWFPYHPIPLHRVFNGLLLCRLYAAISKETDIEAYVREKLQYSPTIVKLFIALKNLMLKVFEG